MKRIMSIKNMMFYLILFLGMQKVYAQLGVGDVINTPIASPSMAAMSQFSDVSVSLPTGLPNIGISLLNAPVSDGGLSWPMSLSYNTRSVRDNDTASDVGNGWSFFGAGVIYKKVINYLDECYDNTTLPSYKKNEFDDLYYYSLPEISGKFRVKRDTINNTFTLINLTPNHAKIGYVRNVNTATFKADSFTITADNGYKYLFNTTDIAKYDCGDSWQGKEYKTAYYLTRILNPIGIEVAAMTYDERKKYKGTSTTNLIFLQNKLKAITSRSGQVAFTYEYDETLEVKESEDKSISDPYSLKKIGLKNPAGEELFSYAFNYTMISKGIRPSNKLRILNSIFKNDKNGSTVEKNSFAYASATGEGILKRVISPAGAVTEYNFENGDTYFNYNDPAYLASLAEGSSISNPAIQYWEQTAQGTINTDTALIYHFNIPGDTSAKKNFEFKLGISDYYAPEPPDPNLPMKPHGLTYVLKRDGVVIIPAFTVRTGFYPKTYKLYNYPGTYTLEIAIIGQTSGQGSFSVEEIKLRPGPFRNSSPSGLLRIKNIAYYKNNSDANASRTVNYGYDSFDLPDSSSGGWFENEKDSDEDTSVRYVLYKNVKVSETGQGSIRYAFKTPDDYPKQLTGGTAMEPQYFWPYYSLTKNGLMSKKETYDEQNTLLTTEVYDYELDHYSDSEYSFTGSNRITSKPAYIKKSIVGNKAYFAGGGFLETGSETWVSSSNLKPYYIKSIADAETSEQLMTYAEGTAGYSHLVTANMTGIPVITEEKKNGKILSRSTTKYENLSLPLPTSVFGINISDGSPKQIMKIDAYDEMGNIVQFTSESEIPVSFIYGYNKTQIIAKIEGARYDDVKNNPALATAVNASNDDNMNPVSESSLVTALDHLRTDPSMAGYQITSYTYDPLIGLTSTTTPNGQRETYEYDSNGKLKAAKKMEKDASGNTVYRTLKEYQYNYKQ